MTPERFQQIEEVYHAARERTAEERAALLAQIDPELRREVESLLATRAGGELLERRAMQNAQQLLRDSTLTVQTVGATLGPYRIEKKLGEGGMGEVLLAVDTRLGRAVAIKITHEQFSDRFEREARAISSLNHPNICVLYDVGPNYLVMELIEGETIAARLKSGPLPVKTVLLYASQILAALAEAHEKGVIHRDLKPGNIMIAKSGIKVLDFGLAKSGRDETVTASRMVLGTPAYMAPEQREGKPADARSDIYSFGCVLYEMLSGTRVGSQRRRVPSRKLESIVSRCLEEDPGRRWQSVAELERELAGATAAGSRGKRMLAAAAAILGLSAAAYFYSHRAARLTDKDTIVLADFDNKTGDPVFDDTLRQGLAVELQQSPFLSLISDTRIRQTLPLMGQPKDARLTPEIAQQVCERTASAAILEGSIASLGSQYVLGLRARNCNTGSILDQEQIQAARREDVLNSLSQIAGKFRTRVGESLATVERHSTPLAETTTSSLEALKAYSTGMRVNLSAGNAAAIPFFRRAVEIDPKFAMAYATLGLSYSVIGESVLSAESTIKAWQLRDRASDPEKFFIDFSYDRQVTGNLEKAYQTLELWLQTYPRGAAPRPQDLLGGLSTQGTGRFERAIEVSREEIAADPSVVFGYYNLASSLFFLDRFPEAESTLQRASERKVEEPYLLVLRYNIALLKGDKDQMDRVVTLAKGRHGAEHRVAHAEALALVRSGRLQAARRSSSRAADLALQEGERETAASYRAARAVWEAVCGNAAEGKRSAMAALELSKGRDVQYAAGLALALSGGSSRSEALAGDLEKRFPEDTFVKFTYVPVLRALAALGRGEPADSVERLQIALPYELAVNGLNFNHFYLGGLHSAYVRGEAFIVAHRYAEAAAEFQKILDHRGIVGADPIGALANLQLGGAYVLSGDKIKAKSAYEAFLRLWKDADPDIPVLKEAKAEFAKLQ
jgi:tetratricopeptide (TPR) repeat protein/predicted Ser/Thr protein kinase